MTGLRRLASPEPAAVSAAPDGIPGSLGGTRIETIAEEWVVEDRWWTDRPIRRRYFELVLADGRNAVVFRDLVDRRWYAQRA
jgi:hypothetical protein